MQCCGPTNILFPMTAEIFYPTVEQSGYGNVRKTWTLDKVVDGNFEPAGSKIRQEIIPNTEITMTVLLSGRVQTDLRITDDLDNRSILNVIVTNIKDKDGNELFTETAGPRVGQSTIFEIATHEPQISPFGGIEYYKLILRRSENQGVDL